MAVFTVLRTHYLSIADELGQTFAFDLVMRLDKLSFEIRLERRTTKGSSSEGIMHIVPVFIPETHNQTNYKIFDQVMFFM